MTAEGIHFLLFVWLSSLRPPIFSHARLCFYQEVLPLCLNWQQKINTPHTPLLIFWATLLMLGVGNHFREKTGRWHGREKIQQEYCEWYSIVSTWAKPKTNTRYVTKSSGLGSSSGVPLGSSVSAKALVFQYTVTETADAVGKCLCRAKPKPLRLC